MAEQDYQTVYEKYRRLMALADNLCRAVETEDRSAMHQSVAAMREFLSKYKDAE